MSDEKNNGNVFNINAVPSCIDEPVKAVLNPGANQIGTLFGDLLSMATSKIHFTADYSKHMTWMFLKNHWVKS